VFIQVTSFTLDEDRPINEINRLFSFRNQDRVEKVPRNKNGKQSRDYWNGVAGGGRQHINGTKINKRLRFKVMVMKGVLVTMVTKYVHLIKNNLIWKSLFVARLFNKRVYSHCHHDNGSVVK